jgi:hypothetical protein
VFRAARRHRRFFLAGADGDANAGAPQARRASCAELTLTPFAALPQSIQSRPSITDRRRFDAVSTSVSSQAERLSNASLKSLDA